MADWRQNLFPFVASLILVNGQLENLKICVIGNPKLKWTHTTKYCDLLGKSKRSPVSCTYGTDRLDCLEAVSRRKADLTVLEPEDLYFSTKWDESSLLIVAEVRDLKKNPFRYGAVVLVWKEGNITGIRDLRGKRLCHPGFDSEPEWSSLFAQYFEERIAPSNCDKNLTLYEDRIKTTSEFFGSACKAGPWAADPAEDTRLKNKYWNLCALCYSGDCRNSEKYRGSGGSITCLKDRVGDVLWTRQEDVKRNFKEYVASSYNYLCDDGRQIELTEEPCLWVAKPWRVIAAHPKSALDVQKMVDILGNDEGEEWKQNFLDVIELYFHYMVSIAKTPEDYLRSIPGYLSASALSEGNCKPKHSVKLCVSTRVEHEKCNRMSMASSAIAIQPALECVQKSSFAACLNSVQKKETDVIVVPPDSLYDAITKFHLKSFLFETGSHMNNSYLVSIVVKKNFGMKKVSDLRGKKLCLTRRNGIGWMSLVTILRHDSLIDSECREHEGLSEYFGDICVMGRIQDEDDSLASCCPNIAGVGSDEENVLHCLGVNGCDVAVIDYNTLERNTDGRNSDFWSKDLRMSDFRLICRTEKATDCHWFWSYPSYLMTNHEENTPKRREIFSYFYQLGQVFGKNSKMDNSMLEIFGPFRKVSNILFRDTSSSFVSSDHWNHSSDYQQTAAAMKECSRSTLVLSSYLFSSFFVLVSFLVSYSIL